MKTNNLYFFTLLIVHIGFFSYAERTKDKMYDTVSSISVCIRRMNGTHQIGCSSENGGSTGIVHFVETLDQLDVILPLSNSLSYVPVIPSTGFNRNVFEKLKNVKIGGLVLYETNVTAVSYTHEESCPNGDSNLEGTCGIEWNPDGTGLIRTEAPYPVFYVNEKIDVDKIRDCFKKFNNFSFETHGDRSLCALKLDAFMLAAIDTPTCIRRSNNNLNLNPVKYCDPMGDRNIWASLFPMGNTKNKPAVQLKDRVKHIILAARLDTTSYFHERFPGAVNPVSSFVTLLATAQTLKKMLPVYEAYDKNVIFLLLNGESYDYIGSQRLVYDIEQGVFPVTNFTSDTESINSISLSDVEMFIELNQISQSGGLHVHHLNETDTTVRNFINKLKKNSNDVNLNESHGAIPPASLQTFTKSRPDLPGLVLSDHSLRYANKFYNSIYDSAANLKFKYLNMSETDEIVVVPRDSIQEYIGDVADMLGRSIYEEITTRSYDGSVTADRILINELLHCYLENANCMVHRAIQKKEFFELPFNYYVGVPSAPNIVTSLIGLSLAWLTGDVVPTVNNTDRCYRNMSSSHVFRYFNMSESLANLNKTRCFRTSMNFTEAESPAFLIEDYDWTSGKYSTWSESIWRQFGMELYLQPSRSHEIMTISLGSVVFALSTGIIYFINAKSKSLFENTGTISPTDC